MQRERAHVIDYRAHRAALRSIDQRFSEWAAARQRREDRAAGLIAPAEIITLPTGVARGEGRSGRAA